MESAGIPSPLPNDSQDVRTALSAAAKSWGDSDHVEALRWLRRAAESASDAGDDMRSVDLAKRAADLRNAANITGSVPPPMTVPPQPEPVMPASASQNPAQTVPATPAAGAAQALQEASRAARAAAAGNGAGGAMDYATAAEQGAHAAAAANSAVNTQAYAGAPSEPPAAPAAAPAYAAPAAAPAYAAPAAPPSASPAAEQHAAEYYAAHSSAPPPAEQYAAHSSAPPAASQSGVTPSSAPAGSTAGRFQTHHCVRVALGSVPNQDGQFPIHPLAEGESPSAGWSEAILLSPFPGARLFPGRS